LYGVVRSNEKSMALSPHAAGDANGVEKSDWQRVHRDDQRHRHAAEGDEQLVHVSPTHGLRAARSGVEDDQQPDDHICCVYIPSKNYRYDYSRCVNRDAVR